MERGADIEAVKAAAPSEELGKRLLIIDFGDEDAAFEALSPARYVHRGQALTIDEVGLELS